MKGISARVITANKLLSELICREIASSGVVLSDKDADIVITLDDGHMQDAIKIAAKYDIPVLVVGDVGSNLNRVAACGVDGYFDPINWGIDEFIYAVREVAGGCKYYRGGYADVMGQRSKKSADHKDYETLSDREMEVYLLIGQGRKLTEIAHDLYLSRSAIASFRQRVLEKLEINTTYDIVIHNIRNGFLRP